MKYHLGVVGLIVFMLAACDRAADARSAGDEAHETLAAIAKVGVGLSETDRQALRAEELRRQPSVESVRVGSAGLFIRFKGLKSELYLPMSTDILDGDPLTQAERDRPSPN